MPDWTTEMAKLSRYQGTIFQHTCFGYTYEFQAENWVGERNDDGKPFLMAKPIKRLAGKQGYLSRMVVFHAESLPDL